MASSQASGDQLTDTASPFGQTAVIDQVAAEGGRVRRRKGALTRTYDPLTNEPEILGIFVYPAQDGTKIIVVSADGTLQVEGNQELLPRTPTVVEGDSGYFTDYLSWWITEWHAHIRRSTR